MSTYAIGDVQGCFDALLALLKKINFNEDKDQLIFLGDIVNRGKQSLQVINFIKKLKDNATMVLGNHDFHLLACALGVKKPHNKDTFNDILAAKNKHSIIDYLLQQKVVLATENSIFVHAGIPPIWDYQQIISQANKISENLQKNPYTFIQQVYGNKITTWHKNLNTVDDMYYSVNAFMRMRFCDKYAKLELRTTNADFNQAPQGYKAWFLFPKKVKHNIYFEHWAKLSTINIKQIFAIDGGYIWGNELRCINICNKEIIYKKNHEFTTNIIKN